MTPAWTILVPTLAYRQDKFFRLLSILGPQLERHGGRVTVLALRNNAERPVGEIRDDLLTAATSDYVSFVDDDDTVPDYYVSRIEPLLDGVDYIGWRMQAYINGHPLPHLTDHSLRYDHWWEDEHGYYRDISHLNPVRRDLTEGTSFAKGWPEDRDWVAQMRGRLKTEHFIEDCMYHYWSDTTDTVQAGITPRPAPRFSNPRIWCPHFSWHPASVLT